MEIKSPAKVNLFLRVVGRRPDGYHELETLMCCIDLHDKVELCMEASADSIECSGADLPCDRRNLALKAANLFHSNLKRLTAIAPVPVAIRLDKRIPVGAGLGGGSSNAAAVLRGLNHYYGTPFQVAQLQSMALDLGADVPFFIEGIPALATGIGEILTPVRDISPLGLVLVYPGFSLSTAAVFKNLNLGLTKCEKKLRYFSFIKGKIPIARYLCNDLEVEVVRRFPVIETIKSRLMDQGAMGASMSGSGSAVYGLFPDSDVAVAAMERLKRQSDWLVWATQLKTDQLGIAD